jgi:hypothetical protein
MNLRQETGCLGFDWTQMEHDRFLRRSSVNMFHYRWRNIFVGGVLILEDVIGVGGSSVTCL